VDVGKQTRRCGVLAHSGCRHVSVSSQQWQVLRCPWPWNRSFGGHCEVRAPGRGGFVLASGVAPVTGICEQFGAAGTAKTFNVDQAPRALANVQVVSGAGCCGHGCSGKRPSARAPNILFFAHEAHTAKQILGLLHVEHFRCLVRVDWITILEPEASHVARRLDLSSS
jgi:hypothetical protein